MHVVVTILIIPGEHDSITLHLSLFTQEPGATSLLVMWQPMTDPTTTTTSTVIQLPSTTTQYPNDDNNTATPHHQLISARPSTTYFEDNMTRQLTCHVIETVTTHVVIIVPVKTR